jgi:PBP1b-binding outer membrane lipoprotein LpoB
MIRMRTAGLWIVIGAVALLFSGCGVGSYQARSVNEKDSPLVNPDILTAGKGDQALYRYVKPGVDVKKYTKVIIDPVLVKKTGEMDEKERENYQTLANNAYVYLTKALEKDFTIVKTPEPDTLRIKMAIINAEASGDVSNTLSTLMPIGMVLSAGKYAATGKQMGVGEITMEMTVTDAQTGELLGAALDRRVGGKELTKLWSDWNNADSALKYWAQRVAYVLCDMRGGGDTCVKPE